MTQPIPLRLINSVAPIRICDNGGWTDTWFAGYGKIFNIGVYPYASVQLQVFRRDQVENRIVIFAENYGTRYTVEPEGFKEDRHPLLEAAIEYMQIPKDIALEATMRHSRPVVLRFRWNQLH